MSKNINKEISEGKKVDFLMKAELILLHNKLIIWWWNRWMNELINQIINKTEIVSMK